MDESEIKSEQREGDKIDSNLEANAEETENQDTADDNAAETDNAQDTKDSINIEQANNPGPAKKKKRSFEIELDFKWEHEYKRERRSVVKYEHIEPSKEEKEKLRTNQRRRRPIKTEVKQDFFCETCRRPFMTIQAYIGHMKKHQRIKFNCSLCSQKFDSNALLIKHKVTHKDEDRTFLCQKCEIAFTDHLEYIKHKLSHQHCQNYKCEECGKNYKNKHGLAIHIETHFDKMITCDVCHRTYKTYTIQNHMKTHTYEIECVECGKKLNDDRYYRYHMISHTGVKPYQCLYCGKGFSNNCARKVHTRLHTNEKPYECKVCHQKFTQQTDMVRHAVTHQTEKTLQCEVCKKMFFHKESLKYHMDIHNNTQRYECKDCGKRIHTLAGLKQHVLHHHTEGRNFACDVCDVAFKSGSDLTRHRKQKYHINNEYKNKLKEKNVQVAPKCSST